jgi:hypothetical protein
MDTNTILTPPSVKSLINPNECFPVIMYVFFLIIYVLCFVSLYTPNLELIGTGLFLALHIITTFFIYKEMFNIPKNSNINNKYVQWLPKIDINDKYFSDKPMFKNVIKILSLPSYVFIALNYILGFKNELKPLALGHIPITLILIAGSVLLLTSFIFLALSYSNLRIKYSKKKQPVQFGKQTHNKDMIKKMWIIGTIFLWLLYGVFINYDSVLYILLTYFLFQTKADALKQHGYFIINIIYLILSVGLLFSASYSVYLGYGISKATNSLIRINKN